MLIQSLQRELKDKEQLIQKSQTLIASLQDQGSQLADTNNVYKAQIQKMEEKLEESKQEIIKGNGIIQKQQAEYKQLKQKLKLKATVVEQSEQTIQKKQTAYDDQVREVSELKKENELQRVELNDLKTVNSTLKTKLTEAQESLKSNQDLITYLNK